MATMDTNVRKRLRESLPPKSRVYKWWIKSEFASELQTYLLECKAVSNGYVRDSNHAILCTEQEAVAAILASAGMVCGTARVRRSGEALYWCVFETELTASRFLVKP